MRPGSFRAFAEAAADNTTTPYILVIDEINRANLAKVLRDPSGWIGCTLVGDMLEP